MYAKLKKFLKIRGVKPTLEIVLIVTVFLAIKIYLQRDLVSGAAPPVQGVLLDGQPVSPQRLRGNPVLVYFWATWCPICKLQQGSIAAISEDHTTITIAMNSGSELDVKAFLEENKLGFPVIVDKEGAIADRFGVRGVPTSFILDPRGDIAFTEIGYTTEWGLRFRLWMAAR
ncbi:MAG TPA: protein disulfide oxidoreductase [Gammaproteobacteria bacterium]